MRWVAHMTAVMLIMIWLTFKWLLNLSSCLSLCIMPAADITSVAESESCTMQLMTHRSATYSNRGKICCQAATIVATGCRHLVSRPKPKKCFALKGAFRHTPLNPSPLPKYGINILHLPFTSVLQAVFSPSTSAISWVGLSTVLGQSCPTATTITTTQVSRGGQSMHQVMQPRCCSIVTISLETEPSVGPTLLLQTEVCQLLCLLLRPAS